jgi:hypothetical protein
MDWSIVLCHYDMLNLFNDLVKVLIRICLLILLRFCF